MFGGSERQHNLSDKEHAMRTLKRQFPNVARIFLGGIFAVMGLNGFLHFLPMPPPPPRAGAFMGALFGSGYLFQLAMATELAAGILLLARRFVPLALALLAPVIVNIIAFHLFLAPGGLGLAVAVLAAELYLAWTHRAAFAPMLTARFEAPAQAASAPEPMTAAAVRRAA
jgi:hypothetical protein